jgi:hypothetical protein
MCLARAGWLQAAEPTQKPNSDTLPMFFGLHSATETNSSLSMTCEGAWPYARIVCTFVSVRVHKPDAAEIQQSRAELAEALQVMTEHQFMADKQRQCGGPPDQLAKTFREMESMKARYPASASFAEMGLVLCRCPSLECYKQGIRKAMELDHDVCKASADSFQVEFTRIGQARKWMNKAEPIGWCSMVTAIVIEEVDGKWTYRQTRLAVDQTLQLCKDLQPRQEQVFSVMGSPGVTGCRVVDY